MILAYDITNCDSISGLSTWLNDVKLYASPDVITCLVGTKKDLESKREVSEEQAKTFAAKHSDIVDVIETSAKVNYNHDNNPVNSLSLYIYGTLTPSHKSGKK